MEDVNGNMEVKSLIEKLKGKAAIRKEAAARLVIIGEPALPLLIKELLTTKNDGLKDTLIEVLGKIGEPAVKYMIQLLGSDDDEIADEIGYALVEMDQLAVGPLTDALKTAEESVEGRIYEVLGKIADPKSFALILEALKLSSKTCPGL